MDRLFKRLYDRQTPPGLEWQILRRLPKALAVGTLLPIGLSLLVRVMPAADNGLTAAKQITTVDIFAIATLLTFWTAIFTIAIGCVVVHVMKGPAYVADAYPVSHASKPEVRRET